ncbi:type II toxin-antitoxin system HicB family antitoxin [Tissierella carlieri]|uniref:type II toxin-antitoxin system HicB family antitoxin n=1 Tax=Tissierella carlieri TaxID=689904 RepID=UPI001C10C430|nr:type II toxin-antitoxin system HicB family antitoxin [Tissierella carlieri]MBU5313126.1 type II toxin-antitoxin system HicB family antitoxin [Tissierella carlieri]MDU5081396.1 type II toxin-antitoxin system HicB family antitoxin [Bacillota bacterium]
MKKVYPIILIPAETGYVVYVPDLKINTEGADIADAIEMARDAIGLWGITEEDCGRNIPEPTTIEMEKIEHGSDDIVTLVDVDFKAYRRANDMRTIRKNVTIPSWLNEAAEKEGINFSQLLQEALKDRLQLQ